MYLKTAISITLLAATAVAHFVVPNDEQNMSGIVVNGISARVREKYMRSVGYLIPQKCQELDLMLPGKRGTFRAKRTLSLRRLRDYHRQPHQRRDCMPGCKLPYRRPNVR